MTMPDRNGLILALLGLSLVVAASIGLKARHDGVTLPVHTAGMQLQGIDDAAAAPDAEDGDKTTACTQRAPRCPTPKQELALLVPDDGQPHESKGSAASNDGFLPKSKD